MNFPVNENYENVLPSLIHAAQNIDKRAVTHLLYYNRNFNAARLDADKLMHRLFDYVGHYQHHYIPVEESIIEISELFLDMGADVNIKDKSGHTALHFAMENRMKKVTEFLISRGANLHVRDKSENPFVHFFIQRESKSLDKYRSDVRQRQQIEKQSTDFIRWMITKGLDIHCTNDNGDTALHYALKKRTQHIAKLMLELTLDCENVDTRNKDGNTPLNILTEYYSDSTYLFGREDENMAHALLAKGANIHKLNEDGLSPLTNAVTNRCLNLLKIFLERGADFHHPYSGGNVLHYFFKSTTFTNIAILNAVFDLLIDRGCDVNAKDNRGMTPLHFAARRTEPEIVERLIEYGANVNSREFTCGYTPLHEAVEYNHERLVVMLLEKGADVNVKTKKGRTVFHLINSNTVKRANFNNAGDIYNYVMRFKNDPQHITRILIRHGAHIDVRDNDGFLPLQAAILRQDKKVVGEFLKSGADLNDSAHVLGVDDYRPVYKLISEHLVKLQVADQPIDKTLRYCFFAFGYNTHARTHERCLIEIERLKKYKISECTSVYDLLRMRRNCTCSFVNNEKLEALISSSKIDQQFPLYHGLILSTYYMAIERRKMLEPAEDAWYKLTNIRLPDLCVYEIISNLSNVDLRMMIEGTQQNKQETISVVHTDE